MDKYHVLEFIGEGSFAKVYKGRRKYSGRVIIIQFLSKNAFSKLLKISDGRNEIYFKNG